jgi:hypothetical protein
MALAEHLPRQRGDVGQEQLSCQVCEVVDVQPGEIQCIITYEILFHYENVQS